MADQQGPILVPAEQIQLDVILSIVSVVAALGSLGLSIWILTSAQTQQRRA